MLDSGDELPATRFSADIHPCALLLSYVRIRIPAGRGGGALESFVPREKSALPGGRQGTGSAQWNWEGVKT